MAIIGVFVLFGFLMMAIMAVTFWVLGVASVFTFIVGGYVAEALLGAGSGANEFLLGGAGAVLILWGVIAYMGNRIDRESEPKNYKGKNKNQF